jgi:hypothetical protein
MVSELNQRLREASIRVEHDATPLSPRAAARLERIANADAVRQKKFGDRATLRAESARRYELGHIVNTLRRLLKDEDDPGTRGFLRDRQFRKRMLRLGRRPRGWIIGRLAIPIQLPTHVVDTECHLILCVDGRLYAALDGIIGDAYAIGQGNPPRTTWVLGADVWHAVEATIPETVGSMIGRLSLTWPID